MGKLTPTHSTRLGRTCYPCFKPKKGPNTLNLDLFCSLSPSQFTTLRHSFKQRRVPWLNLASPLPSIVAFIIVFRDWWCFLQKQTQTSTISFLLLQLPLLLRRLQLLLLLPLLLLVESDGDNCCRRRQQQRLLRLLQLLMSMIAISSAASTVVATASSSASSTPSTPVFEGKLL